MMGIVIKLNPTDPVWPDLAGEKIVHLGTGARPIELAVLDAGMQSGKPSVVLRIDLPDGTHVVAETSARLLCTAARAINARYPDLFEDAHAEG